MERYKLERIVRGKGGNKVVEHWKERGIKDIVREDSGKEVEEH